MLQLTLNSQEYLFVPVPEELSAYKTTGHFFIEDLRPGKMGVYARTEDSNILFAAIPSGSWAIIGTTAEVLQSEELAANIVEEADYNEHHFTNYNHTSQNLEDHGFEKATNSFRSLLQHHNIPHSIILVKQ